MPARMQRGFTLVEMVMVIIISAIIGAVVAVFIQLPVQGYMDSARRAELTDIADTAVRRLARDVRRAVPNSVRFNNCVNPCTVSIEFIPTRDGGRYRAMPNFANGAGDVLQFGVADNSFDIIGTAEFAAGDFIVIGSTQSDAAPPYDQTATGVLRPYTGVAGVQNTVTFANTVWPVWAELPSQRFHVVDGSQRAVTYACESVATDVNGTGTGRLVRYWNYGFNVAPGIGGSSALLADRLSACNMIYTAANQRFGLLTISLTVTSEGESVSLYNEIHVDNAP